MTGRGNRCAAETADQSRPREGRAGRDECPLLHKPMQVSAEETSERFDVIPAQRPLDSISYWSRASLSFGRPTVFPGVA